jgi:hypothetical protein
MTDTDGMNHPLNAEQLAELDAHILARHILLATMCIRRFTGVGIRDALEIHANRYEELRNQRPDDFVCSDDEYWRGFYS